MRTEEMAIVRSGDFSVCIWDRTHCIALAGWIIVLTETWIREALFLRGTVLYQKL